MVVVLLFVLPLVVPLVVPLVMPLAAVVSGFEGTKFVTSDILMSGQ